MDRTREYITTSEKKIIMQFEQPKEILPEGAESVEKHEALRLRNAMQIELIERYTRSHSFATRNEAAIKWIEGGYSKEFARLVAEDPDLLTTYQSNSEAVLTKIEEALYGVERLQKAA